MKQYAQQVRTRLLTLIMAGVAGAGFASVATAAGMGGGIKSDVGTGASVPAREPAQTSGAADAHMGPSGSASSNATERMNANDAEMKQSGGTDLDVNDTTTVKGKRKR